MLFGGKAAVCYENTRITEHMKVWTAFKCLVLVQMVYIHTAVL
jgi:hypothetical protein